MKRSDIFAGLIAGEAIAILALVIFTNLSLSLGNVRFAIPVAVPALIVGGLWVSWKISRAWATFWQLAKFLVTGALNLLIDLGILNLLMYLTGITAGAGFVGFKTASFLVAVTNSYLWNKFWTFERRNTEGAAKEFSKFVLVSAFGIFLNVSIATILVNVVGPPPAVSAVLWGNIAAVAAALAVFVWNFTGYKLLVFRS